MRKSLMSIIALLLVLVMMAGMTACSNKEEEEEEIAFDEAVTQEVEQGPEAVKTIDNIDTDQDIPLQIESITLYEDGSVLVVPTEDLKKNEMKDSDAEGIYPFEDSGKIKDIYVLNYGNAGFRTILALTEEGTISAVNGSALIQDHIIAVMNNVAGRDDFTSAENVADESAVYIVGHTEGGDDVVLDYSLNMTE